MMETDARLRLADLNRLHHLVKQSQVREHITIRHLLEALHDLLVVGLDDLLLLFKITGPRRDGERAWVNVIGRQSDALQLHQEGDTDRVAHADEMTFVLG